MIFDDEEKKPEVISMKNIMLAFGLHVAAFFLLWLFSVIHFKPKETIIPIDLMFEAPPDEIAPDEVKPPEPPKPKPEPKVDPLPKVDEKVDAVVKIKEKKKPEPPKEKPKPPEPKPEPKPEKTKEQLNKEKEKAHKDRLKRMNDSAKVVTNPKPSPAPPGTGVKLDPDWKKHLAAGAKAGDRTQIATSEMQRCVSLIKMALDARWNQMSPDIGRPGVVVLRVNITPNGQLINCKIAKSCGDPLSDKAALAVASTTGRVANLSPEFIRQNSTLTINYTVEER